jgi:hypothetical protein
MKLKIDIQMRVPSKEEGMYLKFRVIPRVKGTENFVTENF